MGHRPTDRATDTKGFTLDDERIKSGRTPGGNDFDELLARTRDIRSSERLFYQKITDIYRPADGQETTPYLSRSVVSVQQSSFPRNNDP